MVAKWFRWAFVVCILLVGADGQVQAQIPQHQLKSWVQDLESKWLDVRLRAVARIGQQGPAASPAIPALMRAMYDPSGRMWYAATEALGQIGPQALPALLQVLQHRSRSVRWCAIEAIGKMGAQARSAIPALLRLANQPKTGYAYRAAEALGQIGIDAIPSLLKLIQHKSRHVRKNASFGMTYVGEKVLPDLLKLLHSPRPEVKRSVMRALHRIGKAPKELTRHFAQLLADKEKSVREEAIKQLFRLGDRVAPAVYKMLSHDRPEARIAAMAVFVKLEYKTTWLIKALNKLRLDRSIQVRLAAYNTLDALRDAPFEPHSQP